MKEQKGCYAIPHAIYARKLRCEIDGIEYERGGGFGNVISSMERGVSDGDVRCVWGVLFHANLINGKKWGRKKISWTIPNDHISIEWIRDFKSALFGT